MALIIVKVSNSTSIRSSGPIPKNLSGLTKNAKVVPKSAIIKKLMIDPKLVDGEIILIEISNSIIKNSIKFVVLADIVISSIPLTNYDTESRHHAELNKIPRIMCWHTGSHMEANLYIGGFTHKDCSTKVDYSDFPAEVTDSLLEFEYVTGLAINNYLASSCKKEITPEAVTVKLVEFMTKLENINRDYIEFREMLLEFVKSRD